MSMNFDDLFKPYSPELRGDLLEYLKTHHGGSAGNNFSGPEYFFIIRDKGLLVPLHTIVRVSRSPVPDWAYLVNSDSLLESNGPGDYNMSMMGAPKGIHNPSEALNGMIWSIHNLNLEKLFDA